MRRLISRDVAFDKVQTNCGGANGIQTIVTDVTHGKLDSHPDIIARTRIIVTILSWELERNLAAQIVFTPDSF
jgi:hypothetical protein